MSDERFELNRLTIEYTLYVKHSHSALPVIHTVSSTVALYRGSMLVMRPNWTSECISGIVSCLQQERIIHQFWLLLDLWDPVCPTRALQVELFDRVTRSLGVITRFIGTHRAEIYGNRRHSRAAHWLRNHSYVTTDVCICGSPPC